MGNLSSGGVHVFLNLGGRSFAPSGVHGQGRVSWPIEAADFDGDGDFDLTVGGVWILVNDGLAGFTGSSKISTPGLVTFLSAADVNGDRRPDVVGVLHDTRSAVIFPNETPRFLDPDCNANGIPDDCDSDEDGDGVTDACGLCPGEDDRLDVNLDARPDCLDVSLRLLLAGGALRPFLRGDANDDQVRCLSHISGKGSPRSGR